MTAVENAQSLVDYANESLSTSYTNLTDIITHELDVPEQPAVEHIPNETLGVRTKSLIDYANDICDSNHDNLTDVILKELKGQRTYSIEEQEPYLLRKSGGSASIGTREHDKLIGGTIAWNQLIDIPSADVSKTNNGITFTDNRNGTYSVVTDASGATSQTSITIGNITALANHKYLIYGSPSTSTTDNYFIYSTFFTVPSVGRMFTRGQEETAAIRILVKVGTIISSAVVFKPMIFDLTQMFGSTVADAIYAMEQSTAGAGVAWFRNMFPKPYYAYNAGELISVAGVESHEMVGRNLLDESTIEVGGYDQNGNKNVDGNLAYRRFALKLKAGTYTISTDLTNAYIIRVLDDNGIISGSRGTPFKFTLTADALVKVTFRNQNTTAITEAFNIQVQFGDTATSYEPYKKHSYRIAPLILRGIPKLDSNNRLYFDGDTYEADGTVTRKFVKVTFDGSSDESWKVSGATPAERNAFLIKVGELNSVVGGSVVCDKYIKGDTSSSSSAVCCNIVNSVARNWAHFAVRPQGVDGMSINQFISLLAENPVTVVYALATPTQETAEPYASPQIVSPYGTEEYVCETNADVIIPVGHDTMYSTE